VRHQEKGNTGVRGDICKAYWGTLGTIPSSTQAGRKMEKCQDDKTQSLLVGFTFLLLTKMKSQYNTFFASEETSKSFLKTSMLSQDICKKHIFHFQHT
jgi:hypothetical protein